MLHCATLPSRGWRGTTCLDFAPARKPHTPHPTNGQITPPPRITPPPSA